MRSTEDFARLTPFRSGALALGVLGTVTTVVALFVSWYGRGLVLSSDRGYIIRSMRTSAGDAWSVVPGTAWTLLAVSLVTLISLAIGRLRRSPRWLALSAAGSVAALVVAVWRTAHPPRPVVSAPFKLLSSTMPSTGGGTVALAATSVAVGAAISFLVATRRRTR
jgi:hypothetical protein